MNPLTKGRIVAMAGANFTAALGGSGVLSKGLQLQEEFPLAFGDSILAYLTGCCLSFIGIIFLGKQSRAITPLISFSASLLMVGLAWAVSNKGGASFYDKLIFSILCLNFALIFIPRTFRIERTAGFFQSLSWVELSYALGYFAGLLFWQRASSANFTTAVIAAAGLYGVSALLDLFSFGNEAAAKTDGSQARFFRNSFSIPAAARGGAVVLVAMTIAVQVGTQIISKISNNTDPLAAFDLGTTLAPVLCGIFGASLGSLGLVSFQRLKQTLTISSLIAFSGFLMLCSFVFVSTVGASNFATLALFAFAAVLYEFIALVLLDWLGKQDIPRNVISSIFGMMALLSTLVYWLFLTRSSSLIEVGVVVGLATGLSFFLVKTSH